MSQKELSVESMRLQAFDAIVAEQRRMFVAMLFPEPTFEQVRAYEKLPAPGRLLSDDVLALIRADYRKGTEGEFDRLACKYKTNCGSIYDWCEKNVRPAKGS